MIKYLKIIYWKYETDYTKGISMLVVNQIELIEITKIRMLIANWISLSKNFEK